MDACTISVMETGLWQLKLRKNIEVIGKRYDVIIMDILKDEFESPYIKKEVKKRYRFWLKNRSEKIWEKNYLKHWKNWMWD